MPDCEYCGQSLKSDFILRQHYREFHNDKLKWACPYCRNNFSRMIGLRHHVAIEHNQKLDSFDDLRLNKREALKNGSL